MGATTTGIPYARREIDDGREIAVCPRCGQRIALTQRKDWESHSGREYADHWRICHEADERRAFLTQLALIERNLEIGHSRHARRFAIEALRKIGHSPPIADRATIDPAEVLTFGPIVAEREALEALQGARTCDGCSLPIEQGYRSVNDDSANDLRWCRACTEMEVD